VLLMDTLELVFKDPGIAERIIARLNPHGWATSRRDSQGNVVRRRSGYKLQSHFIPDGKDFYVAGRSVHHPTYGGTLIQVHLSQFGHFTDFVTWIKPILGEDFDEIWFAEIKRLDLCIDVGLPFLTVRDMLTHPRAHSYMPYTSEQGQTLYIGKRPRVTAVYEKALAVDLLDFGRPELPGHEAILGTRIEVRHTRNRLPFRTLSELPKLATMNPFSSLKVEQLDDALTKSVSRKKLHTIWAYKYLCITEGAQAARKHFAQDGNFQKTIGRFMGVADLDLAQAWQHRLDRFFGPDLLRFNYETTTTPTGRSA
jgi:hypothetical protein